MDATCHGHLVVFVPMIDWDCSLRIDEKLRLLPALTSSGGPPGETEAPAMPAEFALFATNIPLRGLALHTLDLGLLLCFSILLGLYH